MGLAAQEALKQPTWCRLQPEQFPLLAARAHATAPENVLFTYKTHAAAAAGPARAADEVAAVGGSGEQSAVTAASRAAAVLGTVVGPARAEQGLARQGSVAEDSVAADGSGDAAIAAVRSAAAPSSGLGAGARRETAPDAAAVSVSWRR